MRTIDIHSHIGDIFHEQKNVTFKCNVKKGEYPDPFAVQEASGFVDPLIGDSLEEFQMLTNAGQYRCWENTLENLSKKLDEAGIDYIVTYPILPNTSFEEYLACSKFDSRILPFSSADFTLPIDEMVAKLEKDIENGAWGLKIHPVLQNIMLDDPRVEAAVAVFGKAGKPVVSHCGANDYYSHGETYERNPEAGDVKYFIEMAHKFPDYKFIAAHGGGLMGGELEILRDGIEGLDNVWTDTTFRSAEDVKKMVEYFGEDKVMYGTDTPFSSHEGSRNEILKACEGNEELADKILYANAASLLGL